MEEMKDIVYNFEVDSLAKGIPVDEVKLKGLKKMYNSAVKKNFKASRNYSKMKKKIENKNKQFYYDNKYKHNDKYIEYLKILEDISNQCSYIDSYCEEWNETKKINNIQTYFGTPKYRAWETKCATEKMSLIKHDSKKMVEKYTENELDLISTNSSSNLQVIHKDMIALRHVLLCYLYYIHGKNFNFIYRDDDGGIKNYICDLLPYLQKNLQHSEYIKYIPYQTFELCGTRKDNTFTLIRTLSDETIIQKLNNATTRFSFFGLNINWYKCGGGLETGHANMLIYDKENKTIYRFEPAFLYSDKYYKAQNKILMDAFIKMNIHYKMHLFKKGRGPQAYDHAQRAREHLVNTQGFCMYWCYFIVHFILTNYKNPKFKDYSVGDFLDGFMEEIHAKFTDDFSGFIKNFAKFFINIKINLQSGRSVPIMEYIDRGFNYDEHKQEENTFKDKALEWFNNFGKNLI